MKRVYLIICTVIISLVQISCDSNRMVTVGIERSERGIIHYYQDGFLAVDQTGKIPVYYLCQVKPHQVSAVTILPDGLEILFSKDPENQIITVDTEPRLTLQTSRETIRKSSHTAEWPGGMCAEIFYVISGKPDITGTIVGNSENLRKLEEVDKESLSMTRLIDELRSKQRHCCPM